MLEWLGNHETLLIALTGVSLVLFVGTLLIVPAIVVRIPPDYFTHGHRPPSPWSKQPPALRIVMLIVKNVVGCILIVAGFAMLVLPGQGIMTLLIGFFLLDFPGKYRAEKWIVSRQRVLSAINWMRRRRGREPLKTARTSVA